MDMQLAPTPLATPYEPITERALLQAVSGDALIRLTRRSDGRVGWAARKPATSDGFWWVHAGSAASVSEAQGAVVAVIKARRHG